ncbi:MAG: sensor domain-containing diguanylate cyclase [Lachnospiraceae bacterium]|nr:sensor domain-containing diguanylate cyclase [Lachnospiraceae bacterium]
MRSNLGMLTKACVLVYFIILILTLGHVWFYTDMQEFVHADKEAADRDFTSDWILDSGETVEIDVFTAGKLGGGFTASKTLPSKMEETDTIYFSSSNLNFTVYVNNEQIYSFNTVENLTGTGDGISYHMIGLGTKDEGAVIRIEAETAFNDGHGGQINEMQFGAEELYRYAIMRRNFTGMNLSILMIIFGVVIIAFFFVMSYKNPIMRSLWALGLSAILFGLWSLCDTGLPQLLTGSTYASREIVYLILHLAGFPMIYFVNSKTKQQKKIYPYLSFALTVACLMCLFTARYVYDIDMHRMVSVIYFSYATQLIWLIIMLIDNERYCRRRSISSYMKYFYIGASIFIATSFIDMGRYMAAQRGSIWHGSWFRFGLVIFFLFMAFQIFNWWAREKTSLERDRFVNHLLQYIMGSMDPDEKIDKVLEYLCSELHADRAYIFEDLGDGTFDNTYEYCAEGVTPEIDNLKGVKYAGVIDTWYEEYKRGGHVLIYDLEKYREVSENMYEVLKPQGIKTLVTGPLILNGSYIGFFGVDNPPVNMMEEISEIIRLLMFFLSELVATRDNQRRLVDYSYHDALTEVGNRRALREYERDNLDTSRPYGFIMCDINGLKMVNDKEGHEAGDAMIKKVASALSEVFGHDNVYRLGGDEFAVYTYEDYRQTFESKIDKVRDMVEQQGIHVALGGSFAQFGDKNYNSRKMEADQRMYDEKRRFYRDANDRRGRQGL